MIKVKRLGHATFETRDLERQIDYFRDVVGLGLVARDARRAFLTSEVGQLAIVLELGTREHCAKIAFEVAPHIDFAEAQRALSTAGMPSDIGSDSAPGMSKTLSMVDHKGTIIELFSDWTFLAADRSAAGVNPTKLGHVAFYTPDIDATVAFYSQTLGFRVSDWIEAFFCFMRCGFDHHAVNFVRASDARLNHIAFELRDASHMQRACDILGQRRMDVLWGPVRHGPGHNVAVYHRNPAGHVVELFFDLDKMADEDLGYFEPRPWHRDKPQRPKVWVGLPRDIWGLPPSPALVEFARKPPPDRD